MENTRGILLMVFSMFAFASSDAFIKAASNNSLSPAQIIFVLGIVATIAFAAVCLMNKQNPLPMTFFAPAALLRNFGEVLGTTGVVLALAYTDISTMSSIHQATPLMVTLGAAVILGETVGWRRWTAIIFGFLCVVLIIRPGLDGFDANALFALVGVLGLSIRDLATRRIKDSVTTLQLSVFGYLILIPVGFIMIQIEGSDLTYILTTTQLEQAYMMGIIICSMLAYITITASVRLGQISAIVPFRYSRLIFALFYGIVFFGERPDWQTLLGAAGIIASGIFLMMRERDIQTLPSDESSR